VIGLAHISGVPVEELLPWLAAPGSVVVARAWLAVHLRHRGGRAR
jgi:hypothetical protein